MTCRVYVGEYQDRITGAAATAYVVIDENGRLVKAMAQKVKTNKGLFFTLIFVFANIKFTSDNFFN